MKARQSNFEILRIVSMLTVVVAHYIGWGTNQYGGTVTVSFLNGGINSYLYPFLASLGCMGVLCFVMITSYFICGSRTLRFDRIMKVWMPTLFYSVILALISSLFVDVSTKDILKSFAPIGTGQYWFVTKYIALIMLAPMLSIVVDGVSKKGLQVILAILAFLTVTITCGIPYGNQFFGDNPLSVASFVLVFFIASYIRKYDVNPWITRYSGWVFVAGILLQGVGGIGINMLRKPADCIYGGFSTGYNALSLIPATALFLWFKNHNFKDNYFTKIACRLAPYTFAAYLIHDNAHFRKVLWGDIFCPADYWQSPLWSLFALVVPIVIVLVTCFIDMARSKVFDVVGIDKLLKKVQKRNYRFE